MRQLSRVIHPGRRIDALTRRTDAPTQISNLGLFLIDALTHQHAPTQTKRRRTINQQSDASRWPTHQLTERRTTVINAPTDRATHRRDAPTHNRRTNVCDPKRPSERNHSEIPPAGTKHSPYNVSGRNLSDIKRVSVRPVIPTLPTSVTPAIWNVYWCVVLLDLQTQHPATHTSNCNTWSVVLDLQTKYLATLLGCIHNHMRWPFASSM